MSELNRLSATEAAKRIAQGSLKPSELLSACLERIDARESSVGAFESLDRDAAMRLARTQDQQSPKGLLFGLPIAVKNLIDTHDMVTTYGSPIYREHRPAWDAACVAQARLQGAVVLGKTVTTEFAVFHPGKTANPHHLSHTPGGSSSGSAAAVADHMVPLAFGTQTAASIYRPSSFCGVVGYKPTYGTISRAGVKTLAESLDTVGVIANTVEDAALFAAATAGRQDLLMGDARASNVPRIGVCKTYEWERAQPETHQAVQDCASRLGKSGARVVDVVLPELFRGMVAAQIDIMVRESAMALGFEYQQHRSLLSPKLVDVIEQGLAVSDERLLQAYEHVARCRAALQSIYADVDVLLAPAAVGEAPAGLSATGDPLLSRMWTALGNPGIVLPWHTGPHGLPVGILLAGRHQGDRALLEIAHWAQRQRGA